jgi:phage-related protein
MTNLHPNTQPRFADTPARPVYPPLDYAPTPQRHDFVQELTNAARENPVSAALIGMGVLWMFMGGNRTSLFRGATTVASGAYGAARGGAELVGSGVSYAGHAAYDAASAVGGAAYGAVGTVGSAARYAAEGVGGAAHYVADRAGSMLSSGANTVSDGVSNAGSRAADAGRGAGGMVSDRMANVGSQASGAMSSAYDSLGNATGRAREMFSETGSSLSAAARAAQERGYSLSRTIQTDLADVFERQPLLLGAVGIAVGAALAAAIPETDTENRLMGETAESLKERAKQMASEQFERAKSMGDEFVQEVGREAGAQGLTAQAATQAFSAVKDKLGNVVDSAREGLKNKIEQTTSGSGGSNKGANRS